MPAIGSAGQSIEERKLGKSGFHYVSRAIDRKAARLTEVHDAIFQEKLLAFNKIWSVPTTNTRDQKENFQASETTTFKELGKITP